MQKHVSVKKLEEFRIKIVFKNSFVRLYENNKLIGNNGKPNNNNLNEMNFNIKMPECSSIESINAFLKWHKHFGHLNYISM